MNIVLDFVIWLVFAAIIGWIAIFWFRIFVSKKPDHEMPEIRAQLVNTTHPSYDVHAALWPTFRKYNEDFGKLSKVERNFLRVYEFDSRLANGGIAEFLYMRPTDHDWLQTIDAFREAEMPWWETTFNRMIDLDGSNIKQWIEQMREEEWPFSADWDQEFWDAIPQSEIGDQRLYIEHLLDQYVLKHYPWKRY